MSDSYTACFYCDFKIIVQWIFSFSCMINFFVVQMRMFCQYFWNDIIVILHWSISIFLLNQIKSQSFIPVQFANFSEDGFILLSIKHFQAKEYDSKTKVGVFFFQLVTNFIQNFKIFSIRMFLNDITFLVIFSKFGNHWSPFKTIITVFDEFLRDVFHVTFKVM